MLTRPAPKPTRRLNPAGCGCAALAILALALLLALWPSEPDPLDPYPSVWDP